jgi:hypothetical protein
MIWLVRFLQLNWMSLEDARSDPCAAGDEMRHHREAPAPFELLTYGARATGVPPTRSGLTASVTSRAAIPHLGATFLLINPSCSLAILLYLTRKPQKA